MLVLSRRFGEKIYVGDDIVIQVVHIGDGKVKIGIAAPVDVKIVREELMGRQKEQETAPQ